MTDQEKQDLEDHEYNLNIQDEIELIRGVIEDIKILECENQLRDLINRYEEKIESLKKEMK